MSQLKYTATRNADAHVCAAELKQMKAYLRALFIMDRLTGISLRGLRLRAISMRFALRQMESLWAAEECVMPAEAGSTV